MKAISIRQPWAWLIVNGYKDIENRDWTTKVRGRVLIHASKGVTLDEHMSVMNFVRAGVMKREFPPELASEFPAYADLDRGGIVGSVEIIDCVSESKSPWFFGKYGFVLENAIQHDFHQYKGRLGFFEVTL